MRKLKFRAFHKNTKTMYEVYSFCSAFVKINIGLGFEPSKAGIDLFEPIMQFTGLFDKNGKEIYEGDILAHSDRNEWESKNFVAYEVFYHDNDHCEYNVGFQMNRHHFQGSISGTSEFRKFIPKTVNKMEVIGNIYENIELLNL